MLPKELVEIDQPCNPFIRRTGWNPYQRPNNQITS
jgi:hypothetical protein